MTATVREIIERRWDDNASGKTEHEKQIAMLGGDAGHVFPSLDRSMSKVIPVAEVKERRVKRDAKGQPILDDDDEPIRETYLPGVHANRRTYNSVAIEIGIPLEVRETLANHNARVVNVRHYGRPQKLGLPTRVRRQDRGRAVGSDPW